MKFTTILALLFALSSQISQAKTPEQNVQKPDHVIIMVFDAMRPDYVSRYDLKNFKRLQKMGANYPNALVGHLFSETVVAHAVIPTGLKPKDLPWSDDIIHDITGRITTEGSKKAGFYITGSMSGATYLDQLKRMVPENQFLHSRLQKKLNRKTYSIGTKQYAAWMFGGPYAHSIITVKKKDGKCLPDGINVPSYIATNERFVIECKDDYGSAPSFYPFDGARMVHGPDEHHAGGDVWIADAALEVMKNEEWAGLFLTFPAIDKVAHMQGTHEGPRPLNFETPYTLPVVLKKADEQLGRILDQLEKSGLLKRTLIISTADHGGQGNQYFFGVGGKSFQGSTQNDGNSDEQKYKTFWLQKLRESADVKMTFQDSAIRLWANAPEHTTAAQEKAIVNGLLVMSGVTEVFKKSKRTETGAFEYLRVGKNLEGQSKRFIAWTEKHAKPLLDTMANAESPDYVAFLQDDVGYGLFGDHGGIQEKVQRIPMMIYDPSEKPRVDSKELRLMDLFDIVTQKMGL